jgi:hypothetical protein
MSRTVNTAEEQVPPPNARTLRQSIVCLIFSSLGLFTVSWILILASFTALYLEWDAWLVALSLLLLVSNFVILSIIITGIERNRTWRGIACSLVVAASVGVSFYFYGPMMRIGNEAFFHLNKNSFKAKIAQEHEPGVMIPVFKRRQGLYFSVFVWFDYAELPEGPLHDDMQSRWGALEEYDQCKFYVEQKLPDKFYLLAIDCRS